MTRPKAIKVLERRRDYLKSRYEVAKSRGEHLSFDGQEVAALETALTALRHSLDEDDYESPADRYRQGWSDASGQPGETQR